MLNMDGIDMVMLMAQSAMNTTVYTSTDGLAIFIKREADIKLDAENMVEKEEG